jgi:hypothetical protein
MVTGAAGFGAGAIMPPPTPGLYRKASGLSICRAEWPASPALSLRRNKA